MNNSFLTCICFAAKPISNDLKNKPERVIVQTHIKQTQQLENPALKYSYQHIQMQLETNRGDM
jgi:hypothetical protein